MVQQETPGGAGLSDILSSEAPRVLQKQDELPVVVWRRFESETAIECISIGVKGVRQQSPDARMLGNCKRPMDSILQKTKADTLFLIIEIHGKACKNN
ncbi:hypothetical protein GCD22_02049 [Acidithiobacillus thiooxidans ATCC 19377]|uniref:Uncharacterized protein n=1 Tax=Acidithiobacillus thiooxidans ATCC 19377 TaxID=637390 RepID=A0A5P9XQE7_ACITH|nr:hypothetical protein GCD22_02049 [Acidithiobacillus thiooxidans ATCC 19377]